MAKYSFSVYGTNVKFGEIENSRSYYNAQLQAWCYDYGTVSLAWTSINTDPADAKPTHWKITKSYSGNSDSPYDGALVDGDRISSYRLSYIDLDNNANAQLIYTFWVFNGDKWINCGSSTVTMVYDTLTLSKIEKWIPAAWLNQVGGIGDATGESEETLLTKVLSAYSFEYDRLRAEANLLGLTSAYANIPTQLLKDKITDLGFMYEPALGDTYHRSLYRSGNVINGLKGTASGITQYVTSLTHWNTDVSVGHNLMLDYNDSSFEESLGRWTASAGTFARVTYAGSLAAMGTAIATPQLLVAYDLLSAPRMIAFARLHNHSTAPVTLSLPASTSSPITYGIPVKGQTRYLFSGMSRVLDAAKDGDLKVKIKWYDKAGTVISDTGFGTTYNVAGTWKEFLSASDSGRNGKLSPATAAYAVIEVLATPGHNQTEYLFDLFQFSDSENSFEYQDARKVLVTVSGEKENYIPNPSFERGSSGWIAFNGSLVQETNAPAAAIAHGGGDRTVTRTVTGLAEEDTLTVSPNSNGLVPNQTITAAGLGALAKIVSINGNTLKLNVKNVDPINASVTLRTGSVGKLTATSDGRVAAVSEWIPIDPSINMYFSVYLSGVEGKTAFIRSEYSSRQSASEQVQILTDEYGNYYPNEIYVVDSEPVTLTEEAQRLSVFSVAPVYSPDAGNPFIKVSIVIDGAEVDDVFYIDGVLLDESSQLDSFFDGNGAPLPEFPLTSTFFDVSDCRWSYEKTFNFIPNPSFTSTNEWVADSGTTFTTDSTGTNGIPSLYGTTHGKVSKAGGGSINTTAYLPLAALGGEDVVVSAYVRNRAGTYTISTTSQVISTFVITEDNKDQWVRIHATRILSVGETSFGVNISLSTGNGSAAVFYIDGVQAEYGRTASAFLNPSDSGVVSRTNPLATTKTLYLGIIENDGGSYSNYWTNAGLKFSRLFDTLPLVMPHGSSWVVRPGVSHLKYPDLQESLIPSSSFENDLGAWVGETATLNRAISRGTIFDEYITHGGAFCRVVASAAGNYGIKTGRIPVFSGAGYYSSVAIKPENADSHGTYTLSIKFYDSDDILITSKTNVVVVERDDRWAYLSTFAIGLETIGAEYAVVAVNCAPNDPAAGRTFQIDRAVFRE
jgi:hypothetical protein